MIAGVDSDSDDDSNDDSDDNSNDEFDDDQLYEAVTDMKDDQTATAEEGDRNDDTEIVEPVAADEEIKEEINTRPTRERRAPERLDPTFEGKSYAQVVKESLIKPSNNGTKRAKEKKTIKKMESLKPFKKVTLKKVKFVDEKETIQKNEVCHNLISQSINPENQAYYTNETCMYIARTMHDMRNQAMNEGASFAQQCTLKNGLKKFGAKGR